MTFYQALTYLPFWFACLVSLTLGACVGSFLNVIIYRIPIGPTKRANGFVFNINSPRSHCPVCNHQLAWYENIPLLSWAIQMAKCKSCKTTIPARYPAVELLVALLGATAWYATESWQMVIAVLTVSMAMVPATWWLATKTQWNRFMATWIVVLLIVSMAFGAYVWIKN